VPTRDLESFSCGPLKILVVGVGQAAQMIPGDWIREGADRGSTVGINRLPDGKLVGDVDFDFCGGARPAWITPVPGGVGAEDRRGPCLENTLRKPR